MRERAAWWSMVIMSVGLVGSTLMEREKFVVRITVMEQTMASVEKALNKLVILQEDQHSTESKMAVMEEKLREMTSRYNELQDHQ